MALKLYTRYFRRIIRTPVSKMWGFLMEKILKGVICSIINSSRSRPIFELFPQSKIFCINWWLAPNEGEESQNSNTMSFRWITPYYRPHDVCQPIQFLLSTVWNSCLRFWLKKASQWLPNWKLPAPFRRHRRTDVRKTLMFAECFLSLGHLNDDVTPILYPLTFGKDFEQTVNPLVLTL